MKHAKKLKAYLPVEPVYAENTGEVMVTQSDLDKTDINEIMKKYEKTGLVEHVNKYQGQYGDFSVTPDFQTAMNTIKEAERMFMELPASIREAFDNQAGKFVEFANDPENLEAMQEMGLAPKERPQEQPPVAGDKGAPSPQGDKEETE